MAKNYDSSNKEQLELFLNLVAEQVLHNHLSLFIGAGSSMQYGAMSWDSLVDNIFPDFEYGSNTDKAQYAELNGVNIKKKICEKLSSCDFNYESPNTYLNNLLDFDFKSIWTTNYDCIIEKVLQEKSKCFNVVYEYSHFKNLSYPGGCFLFKINGSQTNANTIVITHEDFINYRKSHEAYLILLKRELLCNSFLFLGCSFNDDILRICIKDILNCIENSNENYATNHFAVIAEKDVIKSDYICKDLVNHYKINCLHVSNLKNAYMISQGIMYKVKYNSVFISGAKRFERNTKEEAFGKQVCKNFSDAFIRSELSPYKLILGMGMSIGNFVAGNVKQQVRNKNLNRYLQMEPFPFTSKKENEAHRKQIIEKAGVFVFIYGDLDENGTSVELSGMWKEYLYAKSDPNNIIIPLPCGDSSISKIIYQNELNDKNSFTYINKTLIDTFDITKENAKFFNDLVTCVNLNVRKILDDKINEIANMMV